MISEAVLRLPLPARGTLEMILPEIHFVWCWEICDILIFHLHLKFEFGLKTKFENTLRRTDGVKGTLDIMGDMVG